MPEITLKDAITGETFTIDPRLATKNQNYTFILADIEKIFIHNSDSNHTWTIPTQASIDWPNGARIHITKNGGAGTLTVARGTGVALYTAGTNSDSNITLAASVRYSASILKVADNVWILSELAALATINLSWHELGSEAAAASHSGISTGHIIETRYHDSNRTSGSGGQFRFTGTTTAGKAGNWPNADGYFYDADGKQFAATGLILNIRQFGATGDGATDDTAAILAAIALGAGTIYLSAGNYVTTARLLLAVIGIRLLGAGRSATTILANFRGGAVIEINEARCYVGDMSVSTKAGGARRNASPLGKTPPDTSVDGLSSDRGIFLNEVGLLTFTTIERVEILYQPGDGLNMSGAGSCSRFSQVNINYCGGHGMYADDGDRDGIPKTRNGIVDIVNPLIQQCWGHGIALATDATATCFRFNLINPEVFSNCLGDGGTYQPAFYSTFKAEIAAKAQNLRIELGATGNSDYGIVLGTTVGAEIIDTRFVSCATYGLYINPSCSRIKVVNPYFTAAPSSAGFRVRETCDNVRIEGVQTSELSTIIDAESEVELLINNKCVLTVPGTNSLWYAEEIKSATIASGTCNIQSGIVDMVGEGDVADSVSKFRFTTSIEVPDGYQFTVCNFNSYNLTVQDRTVIGGTANIELHGVTIVLAPNETLDFVVQGGIYYVIGKIAEGQFTSVSSTGRIGYGTGAGGTVTQATSRTTGVTLHKLTGAITLVSAAGTASWQSFTVTNSTVAATDVITVTQKSGTDLNMISVTAVAAGSFVISFATTGGTTTEQPVFSFAVFKGVTA